MALFYDCHVDKQSILKKAQILLTNKANTEIKNQNDQTVIDILNDEIAEYSKEQCCSNLKEWLEKKREIAQILLGMLKSATKSKSVVKP